MQLSNIDICGIRPGEKLHEILISQDEARVSYETKSCYIIASHAHPMQLTSNMTPVPEDFILASNTNPLFVSSIEDIKTLIESA